jgi:hypothetical protein
MSIFQIIILPLLTIGVLSFVYTAVGVIRSGKPIAGALPFLGLVFGGICIGTSVEFQAWLGSSNSSYLMSVGYTLFVIGVVYVSILTSKARK